MKEDLIVFNPLFKQFNETKDIISNLKQYFDQLWQLENVVFLFGAGLSKFAGGPLMSDLSKIIIPVIVKKSESEMDNDDMKNKMRKFWLSSMEQNIYEKVLSDTLSENEIDIIGKINLEHILTELKIYSEGLKYIDTDLSKKIVLIIELIKEKIIKQIKEICPDPTNENYSEFIERLKPLRIMLKRVLSMRRPTQPRLKIFSTNYDLIVESCCDFEGINCNTGFLGEKTRIFNPSNFDLNLTVKSIDSTTFFPNSLVLYKLHGSIGWENVTIDGVKEIVQTSNPSKNSLIFPSSVKYKDSLEMPFGEMFRRFGECVSRDQTIIVSMGYGFMDDHINEVLFRALKNPSAHLVVIEPQLNDKENINLSSKYLLKLLNLTDYKNNYDNGEKKICIIGGEDAQMPRIVNIITSEEEMEDPINKLKKLLKELSNIGK